MVNTGWTAAEAVMGGGGLGGGVLPVAMDGRAMAGDGTTRATGMASSSCFSGCLFWPGALDLTMPGSPGPVTWPLQKKMVGPLLQPAAATKRATGGHMDMVIPRYPAGVVCGGPSLTVPSG